MTNLAGLRTIDIMIRDITFPIQDQGIIFQCIPQRPPMVMVDGLLGYTDNAVVASLTVAEENIFVNNMLLQETGIVEHMAQAVALHTGFSFYLRQEPAPIGYIGSISNLEIFDLVQIGSQLITTVKIIQEFSGVTLVSIESKVNGKMIAKGNMKTVKAT